MYFKNFLIRAMVLEAQMAIQLFLHNYPWKYPKRLLQSKSIRSMMPPKVGFPWSNQQILIEEWNQYWKTDVLLVGIWRHSVSSNLICLKDAASTKLTTPLSILIDSNELHYTSSSQCNQKLLFLFLLEYLVLQIEIQIYYVPTLEFCDMKMFIFCDPKNCLLVSQISVKCPHVCVKYYISFKLIYV